MQKLIGRIIQASKHGKWFVKSVDWIADPLLIGGMKFFDSRAILVAVAEGAGYTVVGDEIFGRS